MGGAAGHMNHLYDNPELSFDEMFSIMKAASQGKLQGTEKLDGVNVFLGYNGGVAKAARNVPDIARGGMDLEDLLAREFKGGPKIQQVYVNAVKAFEMAVQSLSDEESLQLFGPNGEKFYNAEILHTDAKNVVSYSGDVISIHRQGHKQLDPEQNEVVEFDASETAGLLDTVVTKFEISLAGKDMPIGIKRAAIAQLQELGNKEALNVAMAKVKKALGDVGLATSDTVGSYLKAKTAEALTDIPEQYMDVATRRMVGELAWRTPEINNLPKDVKQALSGYWQQAKPIHERSIYPIEQAVHEFTVEMLKGMESAFIIDNKEETENVRAQVKAAKEGIESYISQGLEGSERASEILTKQLDKLKAVDKIDTAVEGFVFEHNGILYKFTGNFAPINQILGLWKYGRGKQVPSISDALKDQDQPEEEIAEAETPNREAQRIAVVPGGFKPPHSGHFLGAKWFLEPGGTIEPADEVHILISPLERYGHSKDGRDGRGIKIDKDMSQELWNLYIKEAGLTGKMKAYVTDNKSPVGAAYDFMAGMQPGQTLILGAGAKDASDKRFDAAQSWSDKKGYQVDVEVVSTPMMAGGVSGTDMRRHIADGDLESFSKSVPLNDPSAAWKIVRPDLQESQSPGVAGPMPFLYGLIKNIINEEVKNKYAVCTASIGKTAKAGTKRSEWTDAENKRYEDCKAEVNEKEELEEVSAMSTGAVEGGVGSQGKRKPYDPWSQSEFEKEIIQELLKTDEPEDADVIELDQGLRLSRHDLPQIKSTDVSEFLKWLESQDIATEPDMVDPKSLTPVQREINLDKTAGMVAKKGLESLATDKPVMVSGDDYIIDGHHRWYALIDSDYPEISVVRIGLGVQELISTMKDWKKTSFKDITSENNMTEMVSRVANYLLA